MAKRDPTTIAENRRARYDYHIITTLEAGIQLLGTEVKSMRDGGTSITEAHAGEKLGEIFLFNANVPVYKSSHQFNHEPKRPRRLLLKKKEINKLIGEVKKDGMTIVPLKLYFNERNRVKVLLGIGRGKKNVDKRETIKQRDWERRKQKIVRDQS